MARKKKKEDPYRTLGVGPGATDGEIKDAFRKIAKNTHPDQGGDRAAFEQANRAYVVLRDPAKRARFDKTGEMDDDAVDQTDQAAWNLINDALAQAIAGDGDPLKTDLIEAIAAHFRKNCAELGKRIAKLQKAKIRAAKMQDRFKRKTGEGENLMARMMRWQHDQIDDAIKTNERAREWRERAIALLADYEFRVDTPEPMPSFGWYDTTSSTATFGWRQKMPVTPPTAPPQSLHTDAGWAQAIAWLKARRLVLYVPKHGEIWFGVKREDEP